MPIKASLVTDIAAGNFDVIKFSVIAALKDKPAVSASVKWTKPDNSKINIVTDSPLAISDLNSWMLSYNAVNDAALFYGGSITFETGDFKKDVTTSDVAALSTVEAEKIPMKLAANDSDLVPSTISHTLIAPIDGVKVGVLKKSKKIDQNNALIQDLVSHLVDYSVNPKELNGVLSVSGSGYEVLVSRPLQVGEAKEFITDSR